MLFTPCLIQSNHYLVLSCFNYPLNVYRFWIKLSCAIKYVTFKTFWKLVLEKKKLSMRIRNYL